MKKISIILTSIILVSISQLVFAKTENSKKIKNNISDFSLKSNPSCISEKDLKSKKITYRGKMYMLPNIPGSGFIECKPGYDCRFGNICKEPNKYILEYIVTEICTYPNGTVKKKTWKELENDEQCEM